MKAATSEASSSSTDRGTRTWVLDHRACRLARGALLLGGQPTRLFRLTRSGKARLDALLSGDDLEAGGASRVLVQRLCDTGAMHVVPPPAPESIEELTIVVPVRDDAAGLARLLEALARGPGRVHVPVIVVDDGSKPDQADEIAKLAEASGALLLRHDLALGPGASRNTPLPLVASPFIAYLDADTEPDLVGAHGLSWAELVAGHFDDPKVAIVAPRVVAVSRPRTGRPAPRSVRAHRLRRLPSARRPGRILLAYERRHSPLDMGPWPSLVGRGRSVSYVPAAAMLVRRRALEDVGGFDPSLRYGEDVDLVWRVCDAGWTVRFDPRSLVGHEIRPSLWRLATQRFGYGTSAAALDRRHPGEVTPFEASPWGIVVAVAPLVAPVASVGVAAVVLVAVPVAVAVPQFRLWRTLARAGCPSPGREATRLVLRSHLGALRALTVVLRRAWWPVGLVWATVVTRRLRASHPRLVAVAGLSGLGALAVVQGARCRIVDDVAYGSGVWWGALTTRRAGPLLPRLRRASGSGRPRGCR